MIVTEKDTKFVYAFEEGQKEMVDLLGGKGSNLAEMTRLGLPVPSGFTISTQACLNYLKNNKLDSELILQIEKKAEELEIKTNKKFNDLVSPLLVSVRSGAKFSMPGMMDTVLNLGMNDVTVETIAKITGNSAFAYDSYRRFIQMFSDVVKEVDRQLFEQELTYYKEKQGYQYDTQMKERDWKIITQLYKEIYANEVNEQFPQEPEKQLLESIEAVFKSWNNPRAKTYRRMHAISDDLGTAVTVQEMVFGNTGMKSGTGVAFTRNPSNGKQGLFGEFLINAQGEDVVAGIRTPQDISQLAKIMPEAYQKFTDLAALLEAHYHDMQDIEFTIEEGQLFILQTRNGKRTPRAAIEIAIDLVEEGVISKEEALKRLTPQMLEQLLHPTFVAKELAQHEVFAQGLPASPGSASGKVYFTAEAAKKANQAGEKTVLLRKETSPEDIEGMAISEAIVTAHGGMTSHAAVVARGMGTCCVVGCEKLQIEEGSKKATVAGHTIEEGTVISVDGSTGCIYMGEIAKEKPTDESTALGKIVSWSKEIGTIKVMANAETEKEIAEAFQLGAEGMGLVRTEHMFFGEKRIVEMRKMILSPDPTAKKAALMNLKTFQKEDFKVIYRLAKEKSATIRLLDPPLHEFIPVGKEVAKMATILGISEAEVNQRIANLAENNPMLGHRGCRLAITNPEIYEMQVAAIMEAAIEVTEELGNESVIQPEIMIPLVSIEKEIVFIKEKLEKIISNTFIEKGKEIPYLIGTMLETPRACLIADKISKHVDFISFGTNDLTQLTFGFSRDDIGKFVNDYERQQIIESDPFQHLDKDGVGKLLKIAINSVKENESSDVSIGICGEVGGDPQSIEFLLNEGIQYVSCSPYRIPAALLTIAKLNIS
ncbi:Pyruvate, phosphate dikinase [Jeotgalibaca dankookensis]|uniref:Pyruvate, phosphate dikinase n=1 Tax=Jeotgalibaca dankookensis TaxID=708126 RepID=A0A1S6IPJ1_9LACT|nr:pyruvate, phosphate dikinase [Jeotgalibaca dankookensis]AQS53370.1 Pyruvate, phosphate dikinase [Jeotgalibaca dankookensis]